MTDVSTPWCCRRRHRLALAGATRGTEAAGVPGRACPRGRIVLARLAVG
jgi:hypothetical protein